MMVCGGVSMMVCEREISLSLALLFFSYEKLML